MKIFYSIKANNKFFVERKTGVQDPEAYPGFFLPVCYIKKLWFGRWQIDYYDPAYETYGFGRDRNQKPNTRLILYPSSIQEVRYIL